MPYAISISDYQTQEYLYFNETTSKELTGYSGKEFKQKGMAFFRSRVHPDDMNEIANNSFSKLIASLHKFTIEEIKQCKISYTFRFKRKDNVWIKFLQHSIILEINEEKNPLLLLSTSQDITQYKKDDATTFNISHYDCESGILSIITQHLNCCSLTSERENEIIRYITAGTKTKEIACKMCLSIYTIRAHKRNIYEKTKTKNIAELINYAFANGII